MSSQPFVRMRAVLDRMRLPPWVSTGLRGTPIVLMFALFIVTGWRGIDYGYHWDETAWQIKPVRDMVASGILMPRAAIYPTLGKWLTFLPAVPAGVKIAVKPNFDPRAAQSAMTAAIDEPGYLLRVRRLYVVVSAFAMLWLYGAVLALRRPWWEALIAAAGLGLSWEYAYHARWVATDCLVVQFAALTLFMLALFRRTGSPRWLYAAAAAAGLATGSKYPAVILLLPVMLTGTLALPWRNVRAQIARLAALGAISFGVYLITTPATLMDPFTFVEQYRWITRSYGGGHWGYSAASALDHWRIAFTYLAVSYFSPYRVGAIAMTAAAVTGAVFWARSDRRIAAVLIGFPLVFLAWFGGKYLAVIARNYLLVVPFLCVLAARGLGEAVVRLRYVWARRSLAGLLVAAGVVHALYLVRAGESIRHIDPKTEVRDAIAYVERRPGTRFRLSPKVRALAMEQKLKLPANVTAEKDAQSLVLFAKEEGPGDVGWKSNDPWLTQAVFGPREVNFNWYSTWEGHDRVVAMTIAKAKATNVPLAK